MTLDVVVASGDTYALPVANQSTDVVLLGGPAYIMGWSLRDSANDAAAEGSGTSTGPAANTIIAQITGISVGTYNITWTVGLQGAAAAADANNFKISNTGTQLETSVNPGAAGEYQQNNLQVNIPAAGSILIQSVGAGTAGVIYSAQVAIMPTGIPQAIVEIQIAGNPIGEESFDAEKAKTQWFGPAGIWVDNQIKLHVIQGVVSGAVFAMYDRP